MNYKEAINRNIEFIEDNISDKNLIPKLRKEGWFRTNYISRGFSITTGYSISEYIRKRKLYQAAQEIVDGNKTIQQIADTYGYELSSFSRAYKDFHGFSPSETMKNIDRIKVFKKVKISESIIDFGYLQCWLEEDGPIDISVNMAELDLQKHVFNIRRYHERLLKEGVLGNHRYDIIIHKTNTDETFLYGEGEGGRSTADGKTHIHLGKTLWLKYKCEGFYRGTERTIYDNIAEKWIPEHSEYLIDETVSLQVLDEHGKGEIWFPVQEYTRAKSFFEIKGLVTLLRLGGIGEGPEDQL